MRFDRPARGEELHDGPATQPRQAASLILLRDSAEGPEVLLVQRHPEQRLMGGAWVFPGGSTLPEDADPETTAVRELDEEAAIRLERNELVPFSRWITPEEVKARFDTRFFVAAAPDGDSPRPDGGECVDARWLRPVEALASYSRGELQLVFPTIKHLEQLGAFCSVDEALEAARARTVEPVMPRVRLDHGGVRVLLPGEPGYAD